MDFPDPHQLLDSSEGQLVQGLDLGLHLHLANVDELYARTSSRTSDGKVLGSLDDGLSRPWS